MPESGVTKHSYLFCQFFNPERGHKGERCDCFDTPSQQRTTRARQKLERLRLKRAAEQASNPQLQESAATSDPAVTAWAPESPWLYADMKRVERFAYLERHQDGVQCKRM